MSVGVHDFEKSKKQRVIVNIEADITGNRAHETDSIESAVNYETLVNGVQSIAAQGHINLLETFAERIASFCLQNKGIGSVSVTVEKPDIFSFADSVGVTILR